MPGGVAGEAPAMEVPCADPKGMNRGGACRRTVDPSLTLLPTIRERK